MLINIDTLNENLNQLMRKDFWSSAWDAAKNIGKNKPVILHNGEIDFSSLRKYKFFDVLLKQIFDGTKFIDEVNFNLNVSIETVEGLMSNAVGKKKFEPIYDGLVYLKGSIQGMTHAQAYKYYSHLINDHKPIIKNKEKIGFRVLNKLMKRKKLVLSVVAAFIFLLVITNPSPNAFTYYIPTTENKMPHAMLDLKVVNEATLDILYGRKYNFGVCSIYYYHFGKTNELYLGILLNFFKI